MTDKETKLIEDNMNVVYWYIKSHNLDYDEWEDVLLLALCEQINKFDPNRGQITTFINQVCKSTINKTLYYRSRKMRTHAEGVKEIYLDSQIAIENGETYGDILVGKNEPAFEQVSVKDAFRSTYEKLNPKEKKIVKLYYLGYNTNEIVDIIGCTNQNISRIKLKVKAMYKKERS